MTLPRFSSSHALRAAFAPEWCAVAALALIDLAWARAIGFHLLIGAGAMLVPPGIFLAVALLRGLRRERTALFLEYVALSLLGSFGLVIFSYLCTASAGPLADGWLLAADRALGFDWIGIYRRLASHPMLMSGMALVYDSLLVQGFYITVLLGLRGDKSEMRELWRLSTIACILCCLGAMCFPALGPFHDFGLDENGVFLPAMKQLLAKQKLVFDAGNLTGVICFPSFHTALALTCVFALRRTGPIFRLFAALNFLMLFTIPFFGGHYLTDMIAGAGVFALALAIVKLIERASAGSARPAGWAASPAQPSALGGATH